MRRVLGKPNQSPTRPLSALPESKVGSAAMTRLTLSPSRQRVLDYIVRHPGATKRFWAKVQIPNENGCLNWLGAKTKAGYGEMTIGSRTDGSQTTVYAHRFVYELLIGPIPEGLEIDHLCRNRPCVNVLHMEPVTTRENGRRGIKGVLTTHCPRGHPYDEANTYRWPSGYGGRKCRACRAARRLARQTRLTSPDHPATFSAPPLASTEAGVGK